MTHFVKNYLNERKIAKMLDAEHLFRNRSKKNPPEKDKRVSAVL